MTQSQFHDHKLLERLSIFNDAVYAIVLTLLVLEFHIPDLINKTSDGELVAQLIHLRPKFFAFILCTMVVGSNWLLVVNVQRTVVKTNTIYLFYFILYLIVITLLPFSCALIGNYPNNPCSYVVFGIFNLSICMVGYFYMKNNLKNKLHHSKTDLKLLQKFINKLPLVMLFIACLAASAFINTKLSFVLFLIMNIIPIALVKYIKLELK